MGTFEREFLRKIFGPICVNLEYRRRINHELYELYDDVELTGRDKIQRLRWLVHVVRMDGQAPARMVFETDATGGSRRRRRLATRWRDEVTLILLVYQTRPRLQAEGVPGVLYTMRPRPTTACSAMES